MESMILRALAVWVLIAAGEVINGNLRVRYLHRRYGKKRAKAISFLTGLCIIHIITAWLLPWVSPSRLSDCFLIGAIWTLLMICLDVYFGRFVFRFGWRRIIDDFNPAKGNLLGLGMVLLMLCPPIVYWVMADFYA